ncbi:hypothetical protein BASA81_003972 [Batrachochytrium salamandrivorans]|nr:hypothetical protein BASA81_003972 [Batrachochytrium salamandrivorans]
MKASSLDQLKTKRSGARRKSTANDLFFASSQPSSLSSSSVPLVDLAPKRKRPLVSNSVVSSLSEWSEAAGLFPSTATGLRKQSKPTTPTPAAVTPMLPFPSNEPLPLPRHFARTVFVPTTNAVVAATTTTTTTANDDENDEPLFFHPAVQSSVHDGAGGHKLIPATTKLVFSPGKESFFDVDLTPAVPQPPPQVLFWDSGKPAEFVYTLQ